MMSNIATAENQNKTTDKTTTDNTTDTKVNADSSGSGGGGGKTITMHLDFKQYFSVGKDSGGDIMKIANKVIEVVNDRLRDGLIALE
jgi:hypothetical protein